MGDANSRVARIVFAWSSKLLPSRASLCSYSNSNSNHEFVLERDASNATRRTRNRDLPLALLPRKNLSGQCLIGFDVLGPRLVDDVRRQFGWWAVFVPVGRFEPITNELLVV